MLRKIQIKNFRSYSPEGVTFENLGAMNLVIGTNNVGKSNLPRVLKRIIPKNIRDYENEDKFTRIYKLSDYFGYDFFDNNKKLEVVLELDNYNKTFIFNIPPNSEQDKYPNGYVKITLEKNNKKDRWEQDDDYSLENLKDTLLFLDTSGGFEDEFKGFNKERIFKKIQDDDFKTEITEILKHVLREPDITIHTKTYGEFKPDAHIEISMSKSDRIIRGTLSDFGSGISQIILISALCKSSLFNECTIFMEEPEQNLHPDALVRLFKYCADNYNSQFIINTHSPWLIDLAEEKNIFTVNLGTDGASRVENVEDKYHLKTALNTLGVKASHILQSNHVIWIEGPSDRLYINKWLDLYQELNSCEKLIEGKHYSFIMYGGSLLGHYGVEGEEGLINILSISRYAFLICDRDRFDDEEELKERVNQWKNKVEKSNSFVEQWITDYKEIENYLSHQILEEAIIQSKIKVYVRAKLKKSENGKKFGNIKIKIEKTPNSEFNPTAESFAEYFSSKYIYDTNQNLDKYEEDFKGSNKLSDVHCRRVKKTLNNEKVIIARHAVKMLTKDNLKENESLYKNIEMLYKHIKKANDNEEV